VVELPGVLEELLPVVLVELVVGDLSPAVVEELLGSVPVLLVVGVVDVALPLVIGSHGGVLGFALCGMGVVLWAGGVAV
jgi:hypothetical protein